MSFGNIINSTPIFILIRRKIASYFNMLNSNKGVTSEPATLYRRLDCLQVFTVELELA